MVVVVVVCVCVCVCVCNEFLFEAYMTVNVSVIQMACRLCYVKVVSGVTACGLFLIGH